MNKLYPIGTVLATREPWKAMLLAKIFGCQNENIEIDALEFVVKQDGVSLGAREGRIVVTPENQALLSPLPLVGDYVCIFEDDPEDDYHNVGGVICEKLPIKKCISSPHTYIINSYESSIYFTEKQARVMERTYNGERLPYIGGWDDVRLPK